MLNVMIVLESLRAQSLIPVKIVPIVVKPSPDESGTLPPREVITPISIYPVY
jgi:hypothetical protein